VEAMKAYFSSSSGIILTDSESDSRAVYVPEMTLVSREFATMATGIAEDWEIIEEADEESLLVVAASKYKCKRCLLNIESLLFGMPREIQVELFAEVEDALKLDGVVNFIKRNLMKAPLARTEKIQSLVYDALSDGFGATANLLNFVRESQPLLQRIVGRWLMISEEVFSPFQDGRTGIWRAAIESGVIVTTINAKDFYAVERAWNSLALGLSSPIERMALIRLAKIIAKQLFPTEDITKSDFTLLPEEEDSDGSANGKRKWNSEKTISPYSEFNKAMKQIDGIVTAISEGRDQNAKAFIQELVNDQTLIPGGEVHAVKSLCNIATHCVEMFRTDFEFECLDTAVRLMPSDGWTLIQLADHMKRVGKFDEAIDLLAKAKIFGEDKISTSSLADVYVHMGRYQEALEIYDTVPDGEFDPIIRGAKADTIRRWGKLDEARREYEALIICGMATDRVFAGQAEIAKLEGRLDESISLYRGLVNNKQITQAALIIYKLALANVLTRNSQFKEAYCLADEVVQQRPFSRQARVFRAAIAGLLGRPQQAIDELKPMGSSHAFNEWINEYVRGLLMLMLNRNRDAKITLLKAAEAKLISDYDKNVVRLGAAVCFLNDREGIAEAKLILNGLPTSNDLFIEALKNIFNFHIAVSQNNLIAQEALRRQLAEIREPRLRELVVAIEGRNWRDACRIEVEMVLSLAA
jgi:tetratricopeptide (TPR) repeat protein